MVAELSAAGLEDAEEIGQGGFGVVYRCRQPALDRVVAVKVLTGGPAENRERFFREQRAMGRLTGHPNIVGVLEVGETASGRPYLVMPYHRLGSLDSWIRDHGPLPVEDVVRLGVKMAAALETAHRSEILHRDIKPSNILLTDYDDAALTDFGIAHLAGSFRTATGAVTGSPAFTAPEVLGGGAPSPASDVYGLGATLFCALTGHAAFERRSGEKVVAQFLRITSQPLPDLREQGIPEDVCTAVETAMCRDEQRRPTAAQFGEQLRTVQRAHRFPVDQMALRAEPGGEQQVRPTAASTRGADVSDADLGAQERSGNLPLELTSFVDRRSEVSEAKSRLSVSCLVTLTGMGGVGKSRLALRVAHKLQADFTDGVFLVELSELRDPAALVDVVATAVGIRLVDGPLLSVLVAFLSSRKVLLVLDNCEQVIDAVAELAQSLLLACPQLRILATSREAIGIGGESVLAVPPMKFPDLTMGLSLRQVLGYDAVTLFAERAAGAVPGFHLTEGNRASVAGICARLDGLPLAIELAAARMRTMSTDQILARLNNRFAMLTRGNRRAPTRQQTLEWCIGWSYDLCTPIEQRLWGRLSVFAGSVELDAAQDVCSADLSEQEFMDALSALVDKSILIREEAGTAVRFRLLETVQEYGVQKIKVAGEHDELCRRHRDWYEHLGLEAEADWVSSRQLAWIARINRELPNLRKALEFNRSDGGVAGLRTAAALYDYWAATGLLREGRRWCERALADTPDAPPADRAKALCTASVFAATLGDLPAAAQGVAELRTLAEITDDPTVHSRLAYTDGFTALAGGDLIRANYQLNDALEEFSAQGETSFRMRALAQLGWTHVLNGDMPQAVARLEEVLTTAVASGETYFQSFAWRPLALAVWQQGEPDRAQQLLAESLRAARRVHDPLIAAISLEILAWIVCAQQHVRRAAALLGAADKLGRSFGGSTIVYRQMLAYHQECEQRARDVLGTRGYAAARQEGSAMGFDTALDFALGEQHEAVVPAGPGPASLTKREREVVDLIAEGLTNKAIATRLGISQRTAQGHVEHILTKLGFTSRIQVAAWAVEHSHEGLRPDTRN
ncbi:protein kinase [Nocardia sp. NPDC059246]|uniref:protein kinase domain-containing protein n=1 Tax=unclassified Nocardia TaxID=2637762 RepID=UPI0036C123C8